jgi:carboxymethylenebutenolidase
MIEIALQDGLVVPAYRIEPEGDPKGAVIVLQETFPSDNESIQMADSFAAKGYVTIAPQIEVPAPGDASMDDSTARALAAIQASVDYAKPIGKIAVVGYGRGGFLAYLSGLQVSGLACAVGYYGTGIAEEWRGKRKIPTLLHFGKEDADIPFEWVIQFRANRPEVSVFDYPAGHEFDREGVANYHAESAALAQERTLFWISQFVEGQPPIQLKNAGFYAQAKTERKKKKPAGDDLGPE